MKNCKKELLKHIEDREILCAIIIYDPDYTVENKFLLPKNHTKKQMDDFLESLDFNYDNGFGHFYFDGVIWYKDGTWSCRNTYDGSEWWEYITCPEIPKELEG